MLLIQDGKIVGPFARLVQRHLSGMDPSISPKDLNALLQAQWYQAGKFRAQIVGPNPALEDLALLDELGKRQAIPPPPGTYKGALLLGSTGPSMRKRLAHFLKYKKERVAGAHRLFLLGSSRGLFADKESPEILANTADFGEFAKPDWKMWDMPPVSEIDLMRMINNQLKPEWQMSLATCRGQNQIDGRPANTEGTAQAFVKWCRFSGEEWSGKYLVLSSNPYAEQQLLALERIVNELEPSIELFLCANEALATLPMATYLDTLAKQLFEEVLAAA